MEGSNLGAGAQVVRVVHGIESHVLALPCGLRGPGPPAAASPLQWEADAARAPFAGHGILLRLPLPARQHAGSVGRNLLGHDGGLPSRVYHRLGRRSAGGGASQGRHSSWSMVECAPGQKCLPQRPQVAAVDFVSINVRKLSLETCEGDMPDRWDVVAKQLEMPNMQDRTQVSWVRKRGGTPAPHLPTTMPRAGVRRSLGLRTHTQSQRNLKVNRKARYLKFTIMDGWQEFCAVNYVGVRGTMQ